MATITRTSSRSPAVSDLPEPEEHRRPGLRRGLAILAGLLGLISLPLILALGANLYLQNSHTLLPGIWIGDTPLAGLTFDEAVDALDRRWNEEYRIRAAVMGEPARAWLVEPAEFGLRVEANRSVERAFALVREGGVFDNIAKAITIWQDGYVLPPWIGLDPLAARRGFEDWAGRLEQKPVEADLEIESGQVIQSPGRSGEALDIEASLKLLNADPVSIMLNSRPLPLVMRTVEPSISQVSNTAQEIEQILGSGMKIQAYDPVTDEHFVWAPGREQIADWISIERGDESFSIRLDELRIERYIEGLNGSLGEARSLDERAALEISLEGLRGTEESRPSQTLQITYSPTMYIVQAGDTLGSIANKFATPRWKLLEYNPEISRYGMVARQRITIPPKDANLSLPVVMDKRIIISLGEQHLWAYEEGRLMADHPISTGMAGSDTLAGIFQIQSHYLNAYGSRWDLWMPYFMGIYQAPNGLENGIHGLPLLSNGVRLWSDVLGKPASYGCVILDLEAAEEIYHWAEEGIVVEIRP